MKCLLGVVVPLLLAATVAVVTASPARADAGGNCDPYLGTCRVDVGGGGGPGTGGGGGGGGGGATTGCQNTDPQSGGCNPCPTNAYRGMPGLSPVCATYLQNQFCSATVGDTLGGLKAPDVNSLTPQQVAALNQSLQASGCPPVVTAASLAQQAFGTIVFPKPSGHRSPSESLLYKGFPFTYINLWTFYWTDPATWKPLTATASAAGLTATVTATPVQLVFDPGNGGTPAACDGPGRAWSETDGNDPPSAGACGYQYTLVTNGPITATETIVWKITWAGTGNTGGQIPGLSTSTSGQLNVMQIQVVNR